MSKQFEFQFSLFYFEIFFLWFRSNLPDDFDEFEVKKKRITRIILHSLPTQRYRRQAVRNSLDIVG